MLYYDEFEIELSEGENCIRIHQCVDRENAPHGILFELSARDGGWTAPRSEEWRSAYFSSYHWPVPLNAGTGFAEYTRLASNEHRWFESAVPFDCIPCVRLEPEFPASYFQKRPIPLLHEKNIEPVAVTVEPDGAVLVDLGAIHYGFTLLEGEPAVPGEVVIGYIEDLKWGWMASSGQCIMYDDRILDAAGPFRWKSIHKRAYRYVRIKNIRPETLRFTLCEYLYPLKSIGEFHCSDSMLERLAEISERTIRLNMNDLFTDCPHRDQGQWMDAFCSAHVALGIGGSLDLTEKCLRQYALCSVKDGRLLSPSITGRSSLVDYTFVLSAFALWFYRVSGKVELLRDIYGKLTECTDAFSRFAEGGPLLYDPVEPPDFIYLDNTFELARKGYSAGVNALYLAALSSLAEIAGVIGHAADAERYSALAAAVRLAFREKFAHPEIEGCFRDTADRSDSGFAMINFRCEFGRRGGLGILEFDVESDRDVARTLEYAEYDGASLAVNGENLFRKERQATWRRQPAYDCETAEISLRRGINHFRFEVPSSNLNWELFFRWRDDPEYFAYSNAMVGETDTNGRETVPLRPVRIRRWTPPYLSQSTHAYAGFAGVHESPDKTLVMLRATLKDEYPRTYVSHLLPSFSTEAGEGRERLPWVMPANTPWPTFFFLTALSRCGGECEILAIIRKYWHDMVVNDRASTTYEQWNHGSSLCHAWGAAPLYFMHSVILGVKHEFLHRGKLLIRPCLFDLEFAEGRVALGIGENESVFVSMKRSGKEILLTVRASGAIPVELDTSLLPGVRLISNSLMECMDTSVL